jgi:hypothetical protein
MSMMNPFGLDLGMHKLPFVGGMFENPDEAQQREQMHNMALAYSAYRPELAQARMNALGNQMSLYQPAVNSLMGMYGPGAVPNTSTAMRSPMGPGMFTVGVPKGTPGPEGPDPGGQRQRAMGITDSGIVPTSGDRLAQQQAQQRKTRDMLENSWMYQATRGGR